MKEYQSHKQAYDEHIMIINGITIEKSNINNFNKLIQQEVY